MSAARLKVTLSPAADQTLLELRDAVGVPKRTKERAEVVRLSHRGWTTEQIADYQGRQVATIRKAIYRWQHGSILYYVEIHRIKLLLSKWARLSLAG